ncbi:MAG: transposase [Kofleriaceae bacterium]|nr:transposase [Kofleriaceae bacterium]
MKNKREGGRAEKRRQFTEEFKAGAVRLVLDEGKTIAQVARDLGVSASVLRTWVVRARADRDGGASGLTAEERAELAQIRAGAAGDPDRARHPEEGHRVLREGELVRGRRQFSDELRARAVRRAPGRGVTLAQVARDLDLTPSVLRTWVVRARAERDGGRSGLTTDERDELRRQRKELRVARLERDILRKSRAAAREPPSARFAFIQAESGWPVATMCRVLQVSRAGFYVAPTRARARPEGRAPEGPHRCVVRREPQDVWQPRIHADLAGEQVVATGSSGSCRPRGTWPGCDDATARRR